MNRAVQRAQALLTKSKELLSKEKKDEESPTLHFRSQRTKDGMTVTKYWFRQSQIPEHSIEENLIFIIGDYYGSLAV